MGSETHRNQTSREANILASRLAERRIRKNDEDQLRLIRKLKLVVNVSPNVVLETRNVI